MRLVLLLALMLPLQSFAWVNCAAHQHCGDLAQQHHCGNCCVAAVAAAPVHLTPPAFVNSGLSLPAYQPLLKVAVDRLDRPPRLVTG